jgi:signal transduction histidine kinase
VGLRNWFDANQALRLPSGGSNPNQVTLGGGGNAQIIVVGPDATFYEASKGTQLISGTVGTALDTSSLPVLEAPLRAALAGKTDYHDLSARSADYLIVAAPVMSTDHQRVVGEILLIASIPAPPPLAADVVGPVVAIMAGSAVVVLILAGILGTIFGFITARGLVGRLARLASATNSWSQGDFSVAVADTSQDELGLLARRLNRMAEQLQNLLDAKRELAVVNERNRLARDLHDSAKQQAFAASAQIGAARALIVRDPAAADEHIAEAEQLINTLRKELSTLILELRPAALGDQGLAAALQTYAADWSRQTGIEATVRAQNERPMPLELEGALFRIAQEALANTARHSGARHADLCLGYESTRITLNITDDGRGFDTAAEFDGFGLHSMRDRAEAIGAQMSIESSPAQGTRITITCPIKDSAERP